jgi:hypothetical protein
MDAGEWWTRWTVRVALAFYVASLLSPGGSSRRRLLWTGGCLAYLLHVGCAFENFHDWSHDAAYEATAQRTAALLGLYFGEGLYANYIFTVVWLADVIWWWSSLRGYSARPRWIEWGVQGFMIFMAFNAAVVFGQGWIRWAGTGACLLLTCHFIWQRR